MSGARFIKSEGINLGLFMVIGTLFWVILFGLAFVIHYALEKNKSSPAIESTTENSKRKEMVKS